MCDVDVSAHGGDDDAFEIPEGFIDNDDNTAAFLEPDSDANDESGDEQDYLSQIEDNDKIKSWWDAQQKSSNLSKRKRKRDDSDSDGSDSDSNDSAHSNDSKEEIVPNKYAERMAMEQSTSGISLHRVRESHLFREFRVIGLVCNEVPICYQKLGDSFFIGTSTGKSFQIYEGKTLRLRISGQSTVDTISAITMKDELTFTAVGRTVEIWYRIKKVEYLWSDGILSFHFPMHSVNGCCESEFMNFVHLRIHRIFRLESLRNIVAKYLSSSF